MNALLEPVSSLIGTYRTFGELGPLYRIDAVVDDHTLRVTVVESGETLNYPLERVLEEPEAK